MWNIANLRLPHTPFVVFAYLLMPGCSSGPTQPLDEVVIKTPAGAEHVMVIVPEGEFLMGSATGGPDESPIHTVSLSEYLIDKVEVSNGQYVLFLNAIQRHTSLTGDNYVYLENPDIQIFLRNQTYQTQPGLELRPMVEITWWGARDYCAWIGGRLPTEAEWEKAARGDDQRRYPWGNATPDRDLLNFNANLNRTVDVGSYPEGASPYGALDMAGNVWEWTNDFYQDDYYSVSPRANPAGPLEPEFGGVKSIRGGSFGSPAVNVQSAGRSLDSLNWAGPEFGFRCAYNPQL